MIINSGYGAASDVKPTPKWFYPAMIGVGLFLFFKFGKKAGII